MTPEYVTHYYMVIVDGFMAYTGDSGRMAWQVYRATVVAGRVADLYVDGELTVRSDR